MIQFFALRQARYMSIKYVSASPQEIAFYIKSSKKDVIETLRKVFFNNTISFDFNVKYEELMTLKEVLNSKEQKGIDKLISKLHNKQPLEIKVKSLS